jgi:hypothetical protein
MKYCLIVFFSLFLNLQAQINSSNSNYSPTYKACIQFYEQLYSKYKQAHLHAIGNTDVGQPLHLFTVSDKPYTHLHELQGKTIILINNGIHPGEPDGINASMQLCENILKNYNQYASWFKDIVLAIIPVYNVDGMLNRNSNSRANQDGPAEYGFRGNAKNLDLNRDFIKMDSKNTWAMIDIFQSLKPHVFIDTHVSNGSDYPYTFTYFFSHKNLLNNALHPSLDILENELKSRMKAKGHEIFHYVNSFEDIPDSGIASFYDSPRYSSGYASLHNTIGLVTETHMLKPFDQRVKATYDALLTIIESSAKHAKSIQKCKQEAEINTKKQNQFHLLFDLDSSVVTNMPFKRFNAIYKTSEVTGLKRLFYDRNDMKEISVKYFPVLKPVITINKPKFYVIPQAWDDVIAKLEANKVSMRLIKSDTNINVNAYYILDMKTPTNPYEHHYLHRNIKIRSDKQIMQFFKGDVIIPCNTDKDYFLTSVLEPQGIDSYFAWNAFDAVMQQKEGFSDYVFEEKAKELLDKDLQLKSDFEKKKKEDVKFANDAFAQLDFIYKRSPYYEKSHKRYPVYRIE